MAERVEDHLEQQGHHCRRRKRKMEKRALYAVLRRGRKKQVQQRWIKSLKV